MFHITEHTFFCIYKLVNYLTQFYLCVCVCAQWVFVSGGG